MIAVLFVISGCEKDEEAAPGADYYFEATLNGSEKDFLHQASFQGGGNDGRWEHIVIGGYEEPIPPGELDEEDIPAAFVIDLWNEGGTFETGTHISTGETPPDTPSPLDFSMDGEYHPDVTYQFDQRDNGRFTLTITELSSETGIKATFDGIITHENEVVEVTDGKLYLPFEEVVGR